MVLSTRGANSCFSGWRATKAKILISSIVCVAIVAVSTHNTSSQSEALPIVEQAVSPHSDARPAPQIIDTIVLHASERPSLDQVIKIFQSPHYLVSSHYSIDKNGRTVQHVDDARRAWHAGESAMPDGRVRVNDFSIGIELINLNSGDDPYPAPQLEALTTLVKYLVARHPIRCLVTHAEIARPSGRKSDPQGFPAERMALLRTFISSK